MPGGPGYKHLEPGDVLVRVNGEVSLYQGQIFLLPYPSLPSSFFGVYFFLFCRLDVYLLCLSSVVWH